MSGDFSNSILKQPIFDPATTIPDPNNPQAFIRKPFEGNIIPPNRIDTISLNYMKNYLDRPNVFGSPGYNVINNRPQVSDADTFTGKLDQRLRDQDTLWFRILKMYNPQEIPTTLKNRTALHQRPDECRRGLGPSAGQLCCFRYEVRLRARSSEPGSVQHRRPGSASRGQLGRSGPVWSSELRVQFDVWGAGINFPRPETDWQWMGSEGVSWIKGNHQMKFGGMYIWQKRDALTTQHSINFTNAQTGDPNNPGSTGNSVASALLGLPAQYTIRNQQYIATWPSFGLYAQDEWKLSSKLTLNYGLRYDTYYVAKLDPGMNNGFDWSTGDWVIGGGVMPPPCSTAGKAPCIPGKGDLSDIPNGNHIRLSENKYLYKAPHDGFQPRLGVAWRFLPNTVLRAGYGMTFDTYTGVMQTFQQSIGTWPIASSLSRLITR